MKPWSERLPERYEAERRHWTRRGFVEAGSDGEVAFEGELRVHAAAPGQRGQRQSFRVRLRYPAGFPYRPPDVELLDPAIRGSRHQSRRGAPCLFEPRTWNQHQPAAAFERALKQWLRGWMLDSFPRELALYELPEYFAPSRLTVLTGAEPAAWCRGRDAGRFSVLQAPGGTLAALQTIDRESVSADVITSLFRDPASEQRDLFGKNQQRNGRWFRLNEQPPVTLRTVGQLAELLRRKGHRFFPGSSSAQHGLVALVFRDAVLDEERFLVLDFAAAARRGGSPARWQLQAPWVSPASPQDLFKRLEGLRTAEQEQDLANKTVLILGAGAVGSSLALALAREGVGQCLVADPGVLRPGNVMRHALDLGHSGQWKAEAVGKAITRINPEALVWAVTDHLDEPESLATLLAGDPFDNPPRPDLVISAIGDDVPETMLSEVAATHGNTPVLFVRTIHNGDLIRVSLYRPDRDEACLDCLLLYGEDQHPELIRSPDDSRLPAVYDAGCATAADPGSGLTSQHAANLGAKRALAVLLGQDDPEVNHWLWVEHAIPSATDARLHGAERMYAARFERHPDCEVCR